MSALTTLHSRTIRSRTRRRTALPHSLLGALAVAGVLSLAGLPLLRHRQAPHPALASSAVVARSLVLGAAALPPPIKIDGPAHPDQSASAMNFGLRSAVAQDRRDGYRDGLVQDLRDGPRRLRVLTRLYGSPLGASHAYARFAGRLGHVLPDPLLHTHLSTVRGIGVAATQAVYTSALGSSRYTVSVLLFRAGDMVCEIQSYPAGRSNGNPSRDRADLRTLATMLAAREAAPAGLAG